MGLKSNDMKIIIPAKINSTRIPNKNWREFHKGKSLVEITVDKLVKAGTSADEIYISVNDQSKRELVEGFGCGFHYLPDEKTHNDVSFREWLGWTCNEIAPGETVGWAQVTSPLFNEYSQMVKEWKAQKVFYDSMVASYPVKQYLLDPFHSPVGWQFGDWHTPSQYLPDYYMMPWVFSILTPVAIKRTGYHIGANPTWYKASGRFVDIDTLEDFEYAQWLYRRANN